MKIERYLKIQTKVFNRRGAGGEGREILSEVARK
jgi:hypothetical protein